MVQLAIQNSECVLCTVLPYHSVHGVVLSIVHNTGASNRIRIQSIVGSYPAYDRIISTLGELSLLGP